MTGDVIAAAAVLVAAAAACLAVLAWDYRDRWLREERALAAELRGHRATRSALLGRLGAAELDLAMTRSQAARYAAQVRTLAERLGRLQQAVGAVDADLPLPMPHDIESIDRREFEAIVAGLRRPDVEEDGTDAAWRD